MAIGPLNLTMNMVVLLFHLIFSLTIADKIEQFLYFRPCPFLLMAFMRFKSLPATLFLLFACLLPICVLFLQVTITPEVASRTVNRAIMAELVRLYKESDLGMRLPAYDGRKSLYTAGELPFVWKEFKIKLVDELDGINGPK